MWLLQIINIEKSSWSCPHICLVNIFWAFAWILQIIYIERFPVYRSFSCRYPSEQFTCKEEEETLYRIKYYLCIFSVTIKYLNSSEVVYIPTKFPRYSYQFSKRLVCFDADIPRNNSPARRGRAAPSGPRTSVLSRGMLWGTANAVWKQSKNSLAVLFVVSILFIIFLLFH